MVRWPVERSLILEYGTNTVGIGLAVIMWRGHNRSTIMSDVAKCTINGNAVTLKRSFKGKEIGLPRGTGESIAAVLQYVLPSDGEAVKFLAARQMGISTDVRADMASNLAAVKASTGEKPYVVDWSKVTLAELLEVKRTALPDDAIGKLLKDAVSAGYTPKLKGTGKPLAANQASYNDIKERGLLEAIAAKLAEHVAKAAKNEGI